MRIAYFINKYGQLTNTFSKALVEEFLSKTTDVHVFTTASSDSGSSGPIQVHEVAWGSTPLRRLSSALAKLSPKLSAATWNLEEKRGMRRLLPKLKALQPDVAMLDFGSTSLIVTDALIAAKIPFVVHFHGSDITSLLAHKYYRQHLKKVFAHASALFGPSHHIRRLLVLEGAPPEKCHKIQLGLDIVGIQAVAPSERQKRPPHLVAIGRLTEKKHPVALVEMMALVVAKHPEARLTIVGGGPLYDTINERIRMRGLEKNVHMTGALPKAQAMEVLEQATLFVQHSVVARDGDQEGWPVSPGEAGLMGIPTVATYHSGLVEHVLPGQTGFLVQEHNFEEMAERVCELIENRQLATRMGETALARYSEFTHARRLEAIYPFLLAACGRQPSA